MDQRLRLALTSNEGRDREAVLQELGQLPENEQAALLPDLCAALTHADSLVRCRAIRALSLLYLEQASWVPIVLDRLRDPSWPVREAAALALDRPELNWPGLEEALLITVLHDPQKLVRRAGVLALANCPAASQSVTPHLLQALNHPHVKVRARALLALGHLPASAGDSVPSIRKELHASHWRVRLSAAEAMGNLGPAAVAAAPDLLRRSFDGHPRVSRAARAALDCIHSALPAPLDSWLELFLTPRPAHEVLLCLALERPDLPEAVRLEMEATIRHRQNWHIHPADHGQRHTWRMAHLFELLFRHFSNAIHHGEK